MKKYYYFVNYCFSRGNWLTHANAQITRETEITSMHDVREIEKNIQQCSAQDWVIINNWKLLRVTTVKKKGDE